MISLANLNKQRAVEKQQPQSITTTVTLSKVTKTIIPSPVLSVKKTNETSEASSSSKSVVKSSPLEGGSESIPFADEGVVEVELLDEKMSNSPSVKGSPTENRNGSTRKGE